MLGFCTVRRSLHHAYDEHVSRVELYPRLNLLLSLLESIFQQLMCSIGWILRYHHFLEVQLDVYRVNFGVLFMASH